MIFPSAPLQQARRASLKALASLGSSLDSISHALHPATAEHEVARQRSCSAYEQRRSHRLTAQVQAAPTLPAPLTSPGTAVGSSPHRFHVVAADLDEQVGSEGSSKL